jgi:hypothetical protein
MPRIKIKATQGETWTPLPRGTYEVQIDAVDQNKVSKQDNPQMMVSAHVLSGPHADKKLTLWYVLIPKSGFRTKQLLEACGIDHDVVELEEKDEKTGKPTLEIEFDPDDLVGCCLKIDATERDYEGKPGNQFSNEQPLKPRATVSSSTTASAPAAAQAAPAAAGAGAVRRTRTGGGVQ